MTTQASLSYPRPLPSLSVSYTHMLILSLALSSLPFAVALLLTPAFCCPPPPILLFSLLFLSSLSALLRTPHPAFVTKQEEDKSWQALALLSPTYAFHHSG